jgi:hypothetical protein
MKNPPAMKKLLLLLTAVLISFANATAQSCLPEGITFSTQEQIDNFQTNYPGCTEIEGDVTIFGNDITNLNGLSALTFIGGDIEILSNPALTSMTGLDNLTSVGGSVFIVANAALTSMTGLDKLTSTGGEVVIFSNHALISLTGLNSLTSVGGNLNIGWILGGNSSLSSLTGLESLTSVGGSLEITLSDLAHLAGLNQLTTVGGHLRLSQNSSLQNLTGLENLVSTGGSIFISDNGLLTNLVGLNNLNSIAGSLIIAYNNALTGLAGLENIAANTITDLYIANNTSLSTCDVQSICDYLVAPNGTVDISNNAPGCNSLAEVIEECMVTVEEITPPESFSVFPNPANDRLTVQLLLEKPESVRIAILNAAGQQMALLADDQPKAGDFRTEIDISKWPSGVYLCWAEVGREIVSHKIIKY